MPPLALEPFFQSNIALDQQQRAIVEESLRNIDSEISQLERTLRELQARHTHLVSERARHQCALSPIRRLPVELVSEIFLYFAPAMPSESELPPSEFYGYHVYNGPKLPWFLAHICRSWRCTALSLGRLWAIVHIHVPDWDFNDYMEPELLLYHENELAYGNMRRPRLPADNDEDARVEGAPEEIESSFRLAGNVPVGVYLNVGRSAGLPILHLLLRHSSKIGELAVFDSPSPALRQLTNTEKMFPRLRYVLLTTVPYEEEARCLFPWRQAPNLTGLSVAHFGGPGIRMPWTDAAFEDIPWAQLTRFRQTDATVDISMYHHLNNLVELSIELGEWPTSFDHCKIGTISLPCLRSAAFHLSETCEAHFVVPFHRIFHMPALEAFSLDIDHLYNIAQGLPFEAQRLKVLRMRVLSVKINSEHSIYRLLCEFPELHELSLRVSEAFSDATLIDLTPRPERMPRLPKLRTLRLSSTTLGHEKCRWVALVDMLKARFEPPEELCVRGLVPLGVFEFPTVRTYEGENVVDLNVVSGLRNLGRNNGWEIRTDDDCRVPRWDDLGRE